MKKAGTLLLALVLVLTLALPAAAAETAELRLKGTRSYTLSAEVLSIVNEERAKLGLPALQMDKDLQEAAMLRAAEVNLNFSHTRPTGQDCFTASVKASGENIAAGSAAAAGVMGQWMNSQGHRENILRERWASIGIGCFYQADGYYYWVQLFSNSQAEAAAQPQDCELIQAVQYLPGEYVFALSEQTGKLFPGDTLTPKVYVQNPGWVYSRAQVQADSFSWTSADSGTAEVNALGQVTAKAPGTAVLTTRTSAGETANTLLTVSPRIYTVTFRDGANVLSAQQVESGKAAPAPASPAKTGHTFAGWDKAFSEITGDLTVNAQWTVNQYTVTFQDGASLLSTQTVDYGKAAQAPANPTKTGHTFAGWDKAFSSITGDLTVSAEWTAKKYTVTFQNGATVLSAQTVDYGKAAKAPANPTKTGHTFAGWDKSFSKITGNLTVTAKWTAKKYTVTFQNGTTVLSTQTVAYGKAAKAPANPAKTGHTFAGWDKSFSKITGNLTVTAKWTAKKYTVTFKNGATVLKSVKVDYGKKAASYKPVKSGYTFIGWYTATNYKTKVDFSKAVKANTAVYAYFVKNPSAPAGVKLSRVKAGQIKLGWTAQSGYTCELQMSDKPSSGFAAVKSSTAASYTKTGLVKNKTYYFRLRCYKTVQGVKVYSGYTAVKQIKA